MESVGVVFKHSRPEHPQTCGKVERFHQTLKNFLAAQRPPRSLAALQAQLDEFVAYFNEVRPHRSLARRTPREAFGARKKARPQRKPFVVPPHCRIRQAKVHTGKVTLRYRTRLYYVAVGRRHEGRRVILVADRDVRVLTPDGELIRHLKLDLGQLYQPLGLEIVHDVSRDPSTMFRDITSCRRTDLRKTRVADPALRRATIGRPEAGGVRSL